MDSAMQTPPPSALPDRITRWILEDGGDNALLLITVDGHLRPHIMMLARDEVVVISPSHLRVGIGDQSQTAENLRLRSSATLAIYDADLACVIKTHAMSAPRPLLPRTASCDLAVEDVRFDTPTATEAAARLVTGLRFEGRREHPEIRAELRLARTGTR